MVIIYTQPSCAPCKAVEAQLTARGIEYTKRDVTTDTDAHDTITSHGFQQTPVIEFDGHFTDISGLRTIISEASGASNGERKQG